MSHEPCLKDTRVWSLQKAYRLGGHCQESGFLDRSEGVQSNLFGVPQGIGQDLKMMMTENAISLGLRKKFLSCENYPRVE